jgi:hypothetical protein
MKIKRKLAPGEAGTKRWIEKFGNNLLCVRYRYDEDSKKKITTVEIAVAETAWIKNPRRIPANKIMHLRINYGEIKLANLVKAAGGKWNKQKKVWELSYSNVVALGLEKRVVKLADNIQNLNNKTI